MKERLHTTCYLIDAANVENSSKPEEPSPAPPTPLYSIGTPSSSDENLFENVKAQTDDSTLIGISSEGILNDNMVFNALAQGQSIKELDDAYISGHLETACEIIKLDKSLDVSLPQRLEGTDDILESDTYLESMEDPPKIPDIKMEDSFTVTLNSELFNLQVESESNEQVDQHIIVHELKQTTGDLHSATGLESHNLDVSQGRAHPTDGASKKLNIAMQHLKSQLITLR